MLGKTLGVKQVLVVAVLSEISEGNAVRAKELFTCHALQVLVEGGGVNEWAHVVLLVLCQDQYEGGICDWFQGERLLFEFWWSGCG